MPELCGSTTVSASIVAKRRVGGAAAGAQDLDARPPRRADRRRRPCRRRSRTRWPGAAACGLVAQAASSRAKARTRRSEHQQRLFSPDRLRKRAKPSRPSSQPELARDPPGEARPLIDQGGVELDEARAGADPVEGVDAVLDPADRDQRQRAAGRARGNRAAAAAPAPSAARRKGRPPRRDACERERRAG